MTAVAFIIATLVGAQAVDRGTATEAACALALAEVERAAAERGWQAEARCVGRSSSQLAGATSLKVQRLSAGAILRSGMMTLAVHGEESSGSIAATRVSLRVTWVAPAWITTRALACGESLQPPDATLAQHRWASGVAVQAAGDAPPQGRLQRSLRAGEALTADAVFPADAVLRGDRVNAVLASGGIEIRLPASVVAPARVGQRVRIQPLGRSALVEGVLIDAHSVQVEAL